MLYSIGKKSHLRPGVLEGPDEVLAVEVGGRLPRVVLVEEALPLEQVLHVAGYLWKARFDINNRIGETRMLNINRHKCKKC